jgi:hypothetical protein
MTATTPEPAGRPLPRRHGLRQRPRLARRRRWNFTGASVSPQCQ